MQIKYHSEADRKKLVVAAAEHLGEGNRSSKVTACNLTLSDPNIKGYASPAY